MDLSIKELNELIYSLGMASTKGMMCDKKLNASLLDKLYEELNYKLKRQADITDEVFDKLKGAAERYSDEVRAKHTHIEDFNVDEEISEEDDWLENRLNEYDNTYDDLPKTMSNGTAQSILDYVESMGWATHKEMHEYYKSLNGSNTFSWCLRNLLIPYKNRKTRRYLIKNDSGKYEVRMANPSNWVVKDYDYKTFNEAPYGD
jgi:hypothetical protein